MVRVIRSGIIAVVAAVAGIGRIGIIAVVADCTIVGNSNMRTCKWIDGIVIREGGGFPTGRGGMASGTIHRKPQCGVVRIHRLIKIRRVASRTLRWRPGKPSRMAIQTIRC